ncbi:hypothetical protein U1Q18_037102 [Sarracenia purpurea var. burkii]
MELFGVSATAAGLAERSFPNHHLTQSTCISTRELETNGLHELGGRKWMENPLNTFDSVAGLYQNPSRPVPCSVLVILACNICLKWSRGCILWAHGLCEPMKKCTIMDDHPQSLFSAMSSIIALILKEKEKVSRSLIDAILQNLLKEEMVIRSRCAFSIA